MFKLISTLLMLILITSACTMDVRLNELAFPSTTDEEETPVIDDEDDTPIAAVIKDSFPLGQPAFNGFNKSFLSAAPDNKFVAASKTEHKVYIFTAEGQFLRRIDLPTVSAPSTVEVSALGVDSTGFKWNVPGNIQRLYQGSRTVPIAGRYRL